MSSSRHAALILVWVTIWQAVARALAGNPFSGHPFYVNPANAKEYDASISSAAGLARRNLNLMRNVPSAYWIDNKAKIRGSSTDSLEGILKDALTKSPAELVVFIWYNLPNRDCDALASNGEICCAKDLHGKCDYLKPGTCEEGLKDYKTGYVDPFISVLKDYEKKVPIVLILEPDSLPNLATNLAHPKCGSSATQNAYKVGVQYALKELTSEVPSVAVYLDAAHGGWMGWENNLEKFMRMLKLMELPMNKVRGFATNVANYQPLGMQCPWCPDQGFRNGFCLNNKHQDHPCCDDPCKLESQYNFGNNELNYAAGLVAGAQSVFGVDARVVIDTGRNGVADMRSTCANWCNPRGAGAGLPSSSETANRSLVDAYFWLKTPGESDGCSQTLPNGKTCPRFDAKCASVDSLSAKAGEPAAPEAGMWYDYQVKQLATNARFKPERPPPSNNNGSECPTGLVPQAPNPWVPAKQSPSTPAGNPNQGGHGSVGNPNQGGHGPLGSACAPAYQQCGGGSWFTGPNCCQTGCRCTSYGGDYHQCVPPTGQYACSGTAGATPPSTGGLPTPDSVRTDAGDRHGPDMNFNRRSAGSRAGLEASERRSGRSIPSWVWLVIVLQTGILAGAGVCACKFGCREECHQIMARDSSPADAFRSPVRYLRRTVSTDSPVNADEV